MTKNIHGNLRVIFDEERNHYAYQIATGGEHKNWVALFSSDNLDDLRKLSRQRYAHLSDINPAKFQRLLAPLN